jgi:hypothetical protein
MYKIQLRFIPDDGYFVAETCGCCALTGYISSFIVYFAFDSGFLHQTVRVILF